jgi:hypothetical protein
MFEYEKAFQPLPENGASRHIILAEDPNLILAVDRLVNCGVLAGQGTLLENDVIYFLNPERDNTPKQIIGINGKPIYLTPQDRLSRPTDLKKPII